MTLSGDLRKFLRADVTERFLRYVRVHTTSDPNSNISPSSPCQWTLLKILEMECQALGIGNVYLDAKGCLYVTVPPSPGVSGVPFSLLAHVDTSPEQCGENVKPRVVTYDGTPIRFPDDPALSLSESDSAQLNNFIGEEIVVASGLTLLGADDKAGVSEIMTALLAFKTFPSLKHPEIRVCFSCDEEVGRSVASIDTSRLAKYCFTMDGGEPGELEAECFDARKATIIFHGVCVHPGAFGKGRLVNALKAAACLVSLLPDKESPEHTEGREGFYYVVRIEGGCEIASLEILLRDFEAENNDERIAFIQKALAQIDSTFPGLRSELKLDYQYHNMRECLRAHAQVLAVAEEAISDAGIKVIRKAIRGGTDGSHLCRLGFPTPNIFAGGMLFHSRKEWVGVRSMAQAGEVIIHLARRLGGA